MPFFIVSVLAVGIAQGQVANKMNHGGLAVSPDKGEHFANRTAADVLGDDAIIHAVHGSGNQNIYLATHGLGLFISTDGGRNFVNKTTADGMGSDRTFGVDGSGAHIYLATRWGLAVSHDGGASFVNMTTADGLGSDAVRDVSI